MSRINVVRICDKFGMRGSTTHGAAKGFAYQLPVFDPARFKVTLYALKKPDPASRALEAMGVELKYLNHSKVSPAILAGFLRALREEQADILHVHGWTSGNFGRLAGRIAGVPTIMHEHGSDPKIPRCQVVTDRFLSRFTDCAVAVSESVARYLVERRFVRPEVVRVIRSGVPLDKFIRAASEDVAGEKQRLGIPVGSPVVGMIGRLDVEKGITYFLQAAKKVLSRAPDAYFLIVGDGPKRDELEAESRSLGIADRVIFTGYRSDIALVMSMLAAQVFASLREGTPHTLYEAMAVGQAIVSTPVDGLGEVLKDGYTAVFVEPGNADQLASGILRLLSDRELADRLARNTEEESRKYDVRATVGSLGLLYEELYAAKYGKPRHT